MLFLLFLLDDKGIRIPEVQKHMDPTDPDRNTAASTCRLSIWRHSWTFVSCTNVPCTLILLANDPSVFSCCSYAQQSIPRLRVLGIYNLYRTIYMWGTIVQEKCSQVLNTNFQKNLLEDASLYLPVCHVFCIILVSWEAGGGGQG